jgi:hypothetical protein
MLNANLYVNIYAIHYKELWCLFTAWSLMLESCKSYSKTLFETTYYQSHFIVEHMFPV